VGRRHKGGDYGISKRPRSDPVVAGLVPGGVVGGLRADCRDPIRGIGIDP